MRRIRILCSENHSFVDFLYCVQSTKTYVLFTVSICTTKGVIEFQWFFFRSFNHNRDSKNLTERKKHFAEILRTNIENMLNAS